MLCSEVVNPSYNNFIIQNVAYRTVKLLQNIDIEPPLELDFVLKGEHLRKKLQSRC